MNVFKAKNLSKAVELLSSGAKVMAGCTNIYVDIKKNGKPNFDYVDISNISELKGIHLSDGKIHIGTLTTFAETEKFFCGNDKFRVLFDASYNMGGPQIRNRATVGGNICDASPACDAGPALMVLGADVKLFSKNGYRTVNINDFFMGVRKTAAKAGELVTEITLPEENGISRFKKVGLRNALAISIVSLAYKKLSDGNVRLAMGSVADRPVRLFECEKLIKSGSFSKDDIKNAMAKNISPISDIRASKEYRTETAVNLLIEVLEKELGYEFD